MATVCKRTWYAPGPTGRKVKHTAWGYTLRVNGKREKKYSAEWRTEQEALAALNARLAEIETGRVQPTGDTPLRTAVEEYLAYKRQQGKRSVDDDAIILRKFVAALGGETPLAKITSARIALYERDRLGTRKRNRAGEPTKAGKMVRPGTIANELSVLRHLLHLAQRWGWIESVPAMTLPKRSTGRLRYLDAAEIGRLLRACAESRNRHLRTIVVVALNTGMRQAEILGLEWERVNLATSTITLYQTKSGRARGVPINRDLYDALVALEPDPAQRTGYLFRNGDARWGQIRTAFEQAVKRAKLQDFTFHDLRHTFASHAVMNGVSLAELKEILGHSTVTMTLRYAHLSPTHLRGAVAKVEGLTSGRRATTGESETPFVVPSVVPSDLSAVEALSK